MPGNGPIGPAGPLSRGRGDAAGHMAGGVAHVLSSAGVDDAEAEALEREVKAGAVLLGVHATAAKLAGIQEALKGSGARRVLVTNWEE